MPVIALGGISLANITDALAAKVQGVAVISAILSAAAPQAAAASLLKKIEEHGQHS
jgi:thiamine-phosphate pyrophosphorylase